MLDAFKRLVTYKWNGNFISTIFKNEEMGTLSEKGFNRIDRGVLTVSNAFFVKFVCSIILIIMANYKYFNSFESVLDIIKNNFIFPTIFVIIGLFVPNYIGGKIKKNRFVKRYPKLYSTLLIIILVLFIEIIVTTIYFIMNINTNIIVCLIGLIANFVNFMSYLCIMTGIIDFCICMNRTNLVQKNQTKEILGEYIEYF